MRERLHRVRGGHPKHSSGSSKRRLCFCQAPFGVRQVALRGTPLGGYHRDLPFGAAERRKDLVALLHQLTQDGPVEQAGSMAGRGLLKLVAAGHQVRLRLRSHHARCSRSPAPRTGAAS